MMVMSLLQTVNSFLDRIFVGQLGAQALAAVGVGGQLLFLIMTLAMSISMGTVAIVARMVGANDWQAVRKATRQSFGLALVVGLSIFGLAWGTLPLVLDWYGLASPAESLAHRFLSAALLGVPALFVMMMISSAFRAMGDTRTPMYAMLLANFIHTAGDWVLIFGRYGFPKWGILGAGVAMALSIWTGAFLLWGFMWRSPLRVATIPEFPVRAWTIRVLRIGVPASLRNLIYASSSAIYIGLLAATREGTAAVAALPIGMTAEAIAFMPGLAFAIAASALVGQFLGAKQEHRAENSAWLAAWQACAVMTAMAVIFYAFAPHFARWFTQDPQVVATAVAYLRINALTEPLLAFGLVLAGALQGAGDTLKPALAALITHWLLRLPLTYLLALRLPFGATGAWWAMALSSGFSGLIMMMLFKQGSWKRVKV